MCIMEKFLPTGMTGISYADNEGSVTLPVGTACEWLKVETRASSIFILGEGSCISRWIAKPSSTGTYQGH